MTNEEVLCLTFFIIPPPHFPTTSVCTAGLVVVVVAVGDHLGVSRRPATSMLRVVGFDVRSIKTCRHTTNYHHHKP